MPSKSTTVRYLFDLILYVPVNKFSFTSTKQGLMCLSQICMNLSVMYFEWWPFKISNKMMYFSLQ